MAYIQGEGRCQGTLFPVVLDDLVPADPASSMPSSQALRSQSLASSAPKLQIQDDPAMIHATC
jgi:hypothetical protein